MTRGGRGNNNSNAVEQKTENGKSNEKENGKLGALKVSFENRIDETRKETFPLVRFLADSAATKHMSIQN